MSAEQKQQKNPFQDTLNLPKTEFSIRANSQTKEPEILQRWEQEKLAEKASNKNEGKKKFVLHDGPPYANGHLHFGHALTYILKDIACKAKRMEGFFAPLIPGWDCHGLPIELKVTKEKGLEKDRSAVDPITYKKYCREFAQHWIEVQKKELKEIGKLADYEHAYITMSPSYESSIIQALATFVEQGYIERKLKTVPWCASCQTVLATAEIEYKDRKDPSLYVLFKLPDHTARTTFPFLFEKYPQMELNFAVWTTTPWTLPLNRAVVLNPEATYVVLQGRGENEAIIMAKDLADKVCKEIGIEKKELAECDSIVFQGATVQHPFINLMVPVLLDDMVQVQEGTACLHSAPGCGPEDYLLGLKHGIEIFSPLSADGKYTKGIEPTLFEGISIADAQGIVITTLKEKNTLLYKGSITHSYPHCWRCHNGLMFRATNQWFCDLSKNNLLTRALEEIERLQFIPERGRARLHSFVANRSEWCISRQRTWGVPIPAIMCTACGWTFLDATFMNNVAQHVAKEGIEFWDRMTLALLIEHGLLSHEFACGNCDNEDHKRFVLERDILDVWFESGISSYAVLSKDPVKLGIPADAYFEGSDQHRGWFQSSLLCGMVLYGHSPTKSIISHGFILDEFKQKMSKSVGNVVAPSDIIAKYSRDILRLWVASADFEDDIVLSEKVLENVAEMYRKIRNTCRFLIANLYDFDVDKDAVEVSEMWAIDQYALAQLHAFDTKIRQAYGNYRYAHIVQMLNEYCTNELSAMYLDILKDRLYVEKTTGLSRRSAQTALYHILDVITRLMAPVLSFLSEEISDFYQKGKSESIHLQNWPNVLDVWKHVSLTLDVEYVKTGLRNMHAQSTSDYGIYKQGQWTMLEELRTAVLKAIELERGKGDIKHPYEAAVTLYIDPQSQEQALLKTFIEELKLKKEDPTRFLSDWFIVSHVTIAENVGDCVQSIVPWAFVIVTRAHGVKCPRCWRWDFTQHEAGLCRRCQDVLD